MVKKLIILLLFMCPVLAMAQGHKGEVAECAPMKEGKVCYRDTVHVDDMNQLQLFNVIEKWAKEMYGKDYFLSNVTTKKAKGLINISSKVELLLNDTDKTQVKYKMKIDCYDNSYSAEISSITFQYDPNNEKKYKSYSAESIIANNGQSCTVPLVKDPKLFCNATFFFAENLFADILNAVNNAE